MKLNECFLFWLMATFAILAMLWPSFSHAQENDLFLHNATYDVVYDVHYSVPLYVTWVLRPADFATKRKRVTKYFKADSRCPRPRVKDSDYRNSGYMRGHMCPAADRTATKEEQKETFLMSNIAPQTTALNCGQWARLEAKTRQLAVQYDSVKVRVGSLFLRADSIYIGSGRVRVPSHFFREVRCARTDSLLLWVIVSQ